MRFATRAAALGLDCVVERNFTPEQIDSAGWPADARIALVRCSTDTKLTRQRFIDRSESGSRHPGHVDQETSREYGYEFPSNPAWPKINASRMVYDAGNKEQLKVIVSSLTESFTNIRLIESES